MNIAQIEENVKALLSRLTQGQVEQGAFIYELLLAYGHRKQSVTRLRSGERNMASKDNTPRHDEVTWKRHLYYKYVNGNDLHTEIDQMRKEKLVTTNKIRFVVVTNFDQLLAVDTKTTDTLDINFDELSKQFDFFLPWAGMEKAVYQGENPADVKAAEKMAKLFDLIKADNFDGSNKDDTDALHNLNVFLTRLLFCFFAEDTEIFGDNQFSNAIQSHTKDDGSDLSDYLNRLFKMLNTSGSERGELPEYLSNFPYVNGGLFADDIPSPAFSAKSRRMLIECGSELDWSDINPDIFGSMIQAVVHPDQRGGMGMHYTSVTNIMKVIEPLFLNDLYEELDKVEGSSTKLQTLQQRLGDIKIFDPACGSGNFLIIAYKELRKLEMEVLKRLQELELEKTGQLSQPFSVIKLSQFYGIELDDFAHEVAILSLWLAEHQMNVEFRAEFGETTPSLPLKACGNIVAGNATRLDWTCVCPNRKGDEIYLIGNPPYVGYSLQDAQQKEDVKVTFLGEKNFKSLDYISCWFFKGSNYISGTSAKLAFVSTNSICQGEQVLNLWPLIFRSGLEIKFAHQSFKWGNNAKSNAAVFCVIIGLQNQSSELKTLYSQGYEKTGDNINPYLVFSKENLMLPKRKSPLSNVPIMNRGNSPVDGGNLLLSDEQKKSLLEAFPEANSIVKRIMGATEFTNGIPRWCLWIEDENLELANSIEPIRKRLHEVAAMRRSSPKKATQKMAEEPHKFGEIRRLNKNGLIIPRHGSDRRDYFPIGVIDSNTLISDAAQAVYTDDLTIFGLLSSRLHLVWIKASCGKIKEDPRYSPLLGYNNFPFPSLTDTKKKELIAASVNLLTEREKHSDMTISQLYDPVKMPLGVREAHSNLDLCVESCYRNVPFSSDDERLQFLFRKYEKMTGGQNA